MSPSGYDDDELLFVAEEEVEPQQSKKSKDQWKILIVDDDEEIHSVTKLALSDLEVHGKSLCFLHAYTGEEALQKVQEIDDIAMILLDVVMERDDAGLRVVRAIREDLKMDEPRIILRTGQPGYAPEESVILEYDINDYKTKTELTRSRLVTTIISSIRSYQQIKAINQSRKGLEKIITSATNIFEEHSVSGFSEGVVTQITSLLGLTSDGVLCAKAGQVFDDEDKEGVYVMGAAGQYAPFIRSRLENVDNGRIIHQITECLKKKEHIFDQDDTVLYLNSHEYEAAVYIDSSGIIEEVDRQLIEVFLANISVGYENVNLFHELSNAAYRDRLTKLNNRTEFTNQLDKFKRKNQANGVVAIVDMNQFSDINDGLGQDTGDALLKAVAERFEEHFEQDVILARVGSDVFGLIGQESAVSQTTINKVFELPFQANEHSLLVSVTIGLCRNAQFAENGKDILKQSYIALNKAKKNLVENYEFYAPEMEEQTAWRLGMIRQLRTDFTDHKLQVWYQPQLCFETNKFIGMEALLRWPTSDGGFISPAVFVPLAEYSGLIIDIGGFVLEKSCEQLRILHDAGFDGFRVAVNVSVPQFRDPKFVEQVFKIIDKYKLPRECIELEITESVVMDEPKIVIDALSELKAFGVNIAIDDFGTGFSSLSYLQKLPLDRIKVDRDFVKDITAENAQEEGVIAETIINLGKRFGLSTIVEGLETEEQAEYMRSLGCEEAQGFMYAKPMPGSELINFLKK